MSVHLFEPLGTHRFQTTELTRTGWNDVHQHGGPPSSLLVRELERLELPVSMRVARVTVQLLTGIPLEPLTVSADVVRAGKRVAVADAHLETDRGDMVATARAQLIRSEPVEVPPDLPWPRDELPGPPEDHPPPAELASDPRGGWSDDSTTRFHMHAVTIRSIDGGWETPGPGAAWIHLDADLVGGEVTSPLCRFMCVADMTNGVASTLPYGEFRWINPDLTVAVHRPPDGAWFGLAGASSVGDDGIGVAHATAYDLHGSFGHVVQTQLVTRWD
jgi:hypothetical protein